VRKKFLSPGWGSLVYSLLTTALRPFGRLRAGCGLHSYAGFAAKGRKRYDAAITATVAADAASSSACSTR
jgi:hypothetical protein